MFRIETKNMKKGLRESLKLLEISNIGVLARLLKGNPPAVVTRRGRQTRCRKRSWCRLGRRFEI